EGLVGSWLALIFYALFSAFMKLGPAAGFTEGIRSITLDNGSLQASTGLSPWVFVVLISAIAVWLTVHHARKLKTPMAALPPRKPALAHLRPEERWNRSAPDVVLGSIATIACPRPAATGRSTGPSRTTPSANLAGSLATGDPELIDWGVML